mmetsp:Transcript_72801/g.158972  ORF Transcript_72801/g.158972 Transcript_72801/m.158972 type:complete len:259 (-) Transcript_72801:345-1121(-)
MLVVCGLVGPGSGRLGCRGLSSVFALITNGTRNRLGASSCLRGRSGLHRSIFAAILLRFGVTITIAIGTVFLSVMFFVGFFVGVVIVIVIFDYKFVVVAVASNQLADRAIADGLSFTFILVVPAAFALSVIAVVSVFSIVPVFVLAVVVAVVVAAASPLRALPGVHLHVLFIILDIVDSSVFVDDFVAVDTVAVTAPMGVFVGVVAVPVYVAFVGGAVSFIQGGSSSWARAAEVVLTSGSTSLRAARSQCRLLLSNQG